MVVKSCGSIVEQLFRRNGGWKRLQGELSVYYWPRIAGSEIADKTEAVYFRNGYLNVKTENPALAHQLSLLSFEIVKRYNQKLGQGVIKGIRVKIGTLDNPKRAVISEAIPQIQLNDAQSRLIENCATEITDPKLADILSRTMHRAFSHNQQMLETGGHPCRACQAVIDQEFDYCPCCERKIKEETKEYLAYLKKNNQELNMDDPKALNEAAHLFLHNS